MSDKIETHSLKGNFIFKLTKQNKEDTIIIEVL